MDEFPIFDFIMDNDIHMVILYLFQGYLLQYFCGSFAESRLKSARWNKVVVIVLFLTVFYSWHERHIEYSAAMAVLHLVFLFVTVTVFVITFYKASFGIAAFLIVTFVAVGECSMMFAYTFLNQWVKQSSLWVPFLEHGYIQPKEFITIVALTNLIGLLLYVVLIVVLMHIALKKVVRNFREKDCEIHRTELLFLVTPGITGLLICLLLRIIKEVEAAAQKLMYDQYPLMFLIVPVIMLLCLMSICYCVKLFQDLLLLNRERNNRVILEKQITSMQEHTTEIERLYSGIRNIKHDMRNTLSIVMSLSAETENKREDKGELEAYLLELNQSIDKLELRYKTGNTVADTLLNMKYHEILSVMPELKLDAGELMFPDGLIIQSYDYGVILGNALDNAIEACKKLYDQGIKDGLFIRLSSFKRGNQFFIKLENSFDGKVFLRKEKEFPQTQKADKKLHGMGLYHIKNIAEKYYGAVEWSALGKVFTLTVMMQNKKLSNY